MSQQSSRDWNVLQFGEMPRPFIVIIEERWEGHRPFFVQLLTSQALEEGMTVLWMIGGLASDVVFDFNDVAALLASKGHVQGNQKHALANVVRDASQDHLATFILDGDASLWSQSTLGLPNLRLLLLRSPYCFPDVPKMKRQAKRLLCCLAAWRGASLYHLTLPGSEPLRLPGQWIYDPNPFIGVSSPVHTTSKRPAVARHWVGAFGHQDERKNVPLLVSALAHMQRSDVGLRLVGPWSSADALDDVKRQCDHHGIPLDIQPSRVTDTQLCGAILETDLVCILNENEASSGILMGASALGRPVLLSGSKSLKRAAKHFGTEWVEPDARRLGQAINHRLSSSSPEATSYKPSPDGREFWAPLLSGLINS